MKKSDSCGLSDFFFQPTLVTKGSKNKALNIRDMMASLLDELHEQGKLTSMSLWVELYSAISQDFR